MFQSKRTIRGGGGGACRAASPGAFGMAAAALFGLVLALALAPAAAFAVEDGAQTADATPNYLTFTAQEAGSSVTVDCKSDTDAAVKYSTDGGKNWENCDPEKQSISPRRETR